MPPVGSAGLMFSWVRSITVPLTLITLSRRTASAAANAAEFGVNTHWVTP